MLEFSQTKPAPAGDPIRDVTEADFMKDVIEASREVPVIVTYHPAYLLRNLPDKAKAWEDLCRARALMRTLKTQ